MNLYSQGIYFIILRSLDAFQGRNAVSDAFAVRPELDSPAERGVSFDCHETLTYLYRIVTGSLSPPLSTARKAFYNTSI
jgi:hypothetical protein